MLAIETSCDETSFALVRVTEGDIPSFFVEKNVVSSQVALHAEFGGVVPSLAKREHLKNLPLIWEEFKKIPAVRDHKIDLIAVTVGPGLEPALWTGIAFAKEIHETFFGKEIPLVGVSHLHGHLYSFLLARLKAGVRVADLFPMVSLIVSGGHTILGVLRDIDAYKKLGETVDDAVGESFDKVARLLNLPYPGGPRIEQLAHEGDERAIPFPSPMMHQKNYNFSYSGLKTSVLYYLKSLGSLATDFTLTFEQKKKLDAIESDGVRENICASFQRAAFEPLVKKSLRAADEYGARSICIGGGVAANKNLPYRITRALKKEGKTLPVVVPPLGYCQDNAAMIAVAAYMRHRTKKKKLPLEADGTLSV